MFLGFLFFVFLDFFMTTLKRTIPAILLLTAFWARAQLPNPPPPAPIAHWVFDEEDGFAILDHSGNGNTAEILSDGVLLLSDDIIPTLHFDGNPITDPAVNAAVTSTALAGQIHDTFTLSAWVNPDSLQPCAPILTKVTDTETWDDGFGLFLGESGELSAFTGETNVLVDENPPIPARPGAWSHVCLVFDGATASLFINGQPHSSVEPENPFLAVNNAPVNIGTLASETNPVPFHGHIADVRVYDTALDAAEILDLFTSTPVAELVDSLDTGIPDLWALFYNLDPFDPAMAAQVLQADGFTNRQKYVLGMNPLKAAQVSQKPLLRVYTPLEK